MQHTVLFVPPRGSGRPDLEYGGLMITDENPVMFVLHHIILTTRQVINVKYSIFLPGAVMAELLRLWLTDQKVGDSNPSTARLPPLLLHCYTVTLSHDNT